MQTIVAIRIQARGAPAPKPPTLRDETKQALLIALLEALKLARRQAPDGIRPAGDFWLTGPQAENPPARDRSAEIGTVLKATALPKMEIAAAARLIVSESG